jgi:hypothetical protein
LPKLSNLSIPPGGHRRFSIAGIAAEITVAASMKAPLELPGPFASFEASVETGDSPEIRIAADSRASIPPTSAALAYESGLNWRVRKAEGRTIFECYHPQRGRLVIATASPGFQHYELVFDEANWGQLWSREPAGHSGFQLPHPLDQLLFLAPLARANGLLLHASGAVIDGKAFVFAGHSGDGKTTLSRLLAAEGLELLSDERIALRLEGDSFRAYGTPWPGEGDVVACSSYPLAGVFLLKKGDRHRVHAGRPSLLAAELLSRAIIPYYLAEETQNILEVVHHLVSSVPLRELEFSLSGGLLPILARAA